MSYQNRVPVPFELLQFLFFMCLEFASNYSSDSCVWMSLGICLRLGFFAMLRPIEICRLRRRDLHRYCFLRRGDRCDAYVIGLLNPKTSRWFGKRQHVVLKDIGLVLCLTWCLSSLSDTELLWRGGTFVLRECFARLLCMLNLSCLGLKPSSLRCGGATFYFISGSCFIAALQFHGRWHSLLSLQCYIQESGCALVLAQLDEGQWDSTKRVVTAFEALWEAAPVVEYQQFVVLLHSKPWRS